MKKIIIRILIGIVVVLFLFIGLFIVPYFTNTIMPWDRSNAIETTLLWGGLAELPDATENLNIETSGSMFTRTFILEFQLPQTELHEWLARSKRLKDLTPTIQSDGTKLYEVYPGERRAMGGTVLINPRNGSVKIKMSWS